MKNCLGDEENDYGTDYWNQFKKNNNNTSAIEQMSITEVRKYKKEMKKKFQNQTQNHPFYITDLLSMGMPIQEFAFRLQKGLHEKRLNKDPNSEQLYKNLETDTESDGCYNNESNDSNESNESNKYEEGNETHENKKIVKRAENTITTVKKRGRPRKNNNNTVITTKDNHNNNNNNNHPCKQSPNLMSFCQTSSDYS